MENQIFKPRTTKKVAGNMFGASFRVYKETFKVRGEKKIWVLEVDGKVVERYSKKRSAVTKLNVILTKKEKNQIDVEPSKEVSYGDICSLHDERKQYTKDNNLENLDNSELLNFADNLDLVIPKGMPNGGIIRAIEMFLYPYPSQEKDVASGAFTVKCVVGTTGAKFRVRLKVQYPA